MLLSPSSLMGIETIKTRNCQRLGRGCCWGSAGRCCPVTSRKALFIFLGSLRFHAGQELQGQGQAERLLSLQPGQQPDSRGAESNGSAPASGSAPSRQLPSTGAGESAHPKDHASSPAASSRATSLLQPSLWLQAKAGLPEQSGGALGTRINPRENIRAAEPGWTTHTSATTSLLPQVSPLTSVTCCLSRWKICPELVAAMRSYTRYPGWLLSPQSPVSTNTTCHNNSPHSITHSHGVSVHPREGMHLTSTTPQYIEPARGMQNSPH